jgi:hypothetical protein
VRGEHRVQLHPEQDVQCLDAELRIQALNILNGKYREVGIGARTENYNGSKTTMYTADFGARR